MGQLLMLLRRRIVIASLAKLEETQQLAGETHSSGHENKINTLSMLFYTYILYLISMRFSTYFALRLN